MTLTIATALVIFFLALQQQNVIHGHYFYAMLTSYFIAASQVTMFLLMIEKGFDAIPYMGTGGAIGSISAMYFHRKFIRRH